MGSLCNNVSNQRRFLIIIAHHRLRLPSFVVDPFRFYIWKDQKLIWLILIILVLFRGNIFLRIYWNWMLNRISPSFLKFFFITQELWIIFLQLRFQKLLPSFLPIFFEIFDVMLLFFKLSHLLWRQLFQIDFKLICNFCCIVKDLLKLLLLLLATFNFDLILRKIQLWF